MELRETEESQIRPADQPVAIVEDEELEGETRAVSAGLAVTAGGAALICAGALSPVAGIIAGPVVGGLTYFGARRYGVNPEI